jgi:hypothetical protein
VSTLRVPDEHPSSTLGVPPLHFPIECRWSTPAVPGEYPEYSGVPPKYSNAPVFCLPQVAVDVQTRREVLAGGLERMADGDEAVSTLQYPGRNRGSASPK